MPGSAWSARAATAKRSRSIIERFYRDVRAACISEGTSQIDLLNIAKHLLR